MTKRDLKMLERLFYAEVRAALSASGLPMVQTKSKQMERLKAEGYVQEMTATLGGRFPITVTGWTLTEFGRFTYCMSCPDDETEENSTKTDTPP